MSRRASDERSVSESSGSSGDSNPIVTTVSPDTSSIISHVLPKTAVKILTWNVDFMAPNPRTRLSTVLEHIQVDVFGCSSDEEQPDPCCILLQEVNPEAFPEILENEWVRQHFCVVPVRPDDWPDGHYGNVTLVTRTIAVLSAQLLQFGNSLMGRHALVVDLRLDAPKHGTSKASESSTSDEETERRSLTAPTVTVRVANVHLESLPMGTSMRPGQLSAAADMVRADGVHAGLIAGDMNAIAPEDAVIHEQAGLIDAWTGGEDEEDALTWGHQPPMEFPPGRLDRMFYTPNGRCAVVEPERVGVGLQTIEGQWASDHCGLVTTLRVR
ncbi:hypothetical protein BDW22DRAFT_1429000 [Trametopsis cervina]|nr:hypothetical protein BDW22DRAFT_1429000 [Trametopsis cervina]